MAEMTVREAVAALDADIDRAETRLARAETTLADLRLKRQGAEALLSYMNADIVPARVTPSEGDATATDAVYDVMRSASEPELSIDFIVNALLEAGHSYTRDQARDGIYYLRRKRMVEHAGRRGWWRLTDTSAPVLAGAEVSDRSDQEDRSWEDGDTSGAVAPGDLGAHQAWTPAHRGHRDGASIEEVPA